MDDIRKLINRANLKPSVKVQVSRYVDRLKTERNYAQLLFKLKNIIHENPKLKSFRAFKAYEPAEDYVEIKLFRQLTTNPEKSNQSARHWFSAKYALADPVWVEYNGEYFGSATHGDVKDIIVPRWFLENTRKTELDIYRSSKTEDTLVSTGSFVDGIQAFGDDTAFLNRLENVARMSDEISALITAESRSGELTDLLIQIVGSRPMPVIPHKQRPAYLRPLAATGGSDPKLSHKAFHNLIENANWDSPEEMFQAPVWNHLGACVPNAFLNTFYEGDQKRLASIKKREGKLPMNMKNLWKIMFQGKLYPGDNNWPPITLKDIEKACLYWRVKGVAYNTLGQEVWKMSPVSVERYNQGQMCLMIKDNHAFQVSDKWVKGWLTRKDSCSKVELSERGKASYLASYYLRTDAARQFCGWASSVDEFYRIATRQALSDAPEIHILWGGCVDLTKVIPEIIVNYPAMPEPRPKHGQNYRASEFKMWLHRKWVFLHEPPFKAPRNMPLELLNKAVALKHKFKRCLVPENRSTYAPGFKETLVKYRAVPPHIAFQDYDPQEEHIVLDHTKFYISILNEIKKLPKFGIFDRVVAYDGHKVENLTMYGYTVLKAALTSDLLVMFPADRGFTYGMCLSPYLKYVEIECFVRPMKAVDNPFPPVIDEFFEMEFPDGLSQEDEKAFRKSGQKGPLLEGVGELGKVRNTSCDYVFTKSEEEAVAQRLIYGYGTVVCSPAPYFTLKLKREQELKDGYLPVQHLIYDLARFKLAELMRAVGTENVVAVNVDSVFLRKGTPHEFTEKYDTNAYKNLGKVCEEPQTKTVRAKQFQRSAKPPITILPRLQVVKHSRPDKELNPEAFDDIFEQGTDIIVLSSMPGSGKSQLLKDYAKRACSDLSVGIVCPTNAQARAVGGITLYTLVGKTLGTEHMAPRNARFYDAVILEEVGMWNYVDWQMFKEYRDAHPYTRFLANGDTRQIPPIESNWYGPEAYQARFFQEAMDEMFPVQIHLYEPKRFKAEQVPRLKQMYRDFWDLVLPLSALIAKYSRRGMPKGVCVAYRNDVVGYVNEKEHKGSEYYPGLTLVKTSSDGKGDLGLDGLSKPKLKKGFEVQVSSVDSGQIQVYDSITDLTYDFTLEYVRKNFTYAYCYTGHKIQGRSYDCPVVIYDSDFQYVSRNWLWVAFTRARDLDQIYIGDTPSSPELLDHLIIKKLKQYMRDDRVKNRKSDLIQNSEAEAIAWFRGLYDKSKKKCSAPLKDCTATLWLGHKGNLTLDRTNNDFGHTRSNVRLCCEECNERRKDSHIIE